MIGNKFNFLFIALTLFLPMGASAQVASKYECDARTDGGTHGRLKVDLKKKTYIMVDKSGTQRTLFDANTVCGWTPGTGMTGVSCPLDAQTGPDGYLSVSLECDRVTGSGSQVVTTGSLIMQDGNGHLICYVYSNPQEHIGLSNCSAN